MAELTPMMKQYLEIKKDNPDSILFFRLQNYSKTEYKQRCKPSQKRYFL